MIFTTNHFKNHLIFTLICLPLKTFTFYFTDEYNNNENGLISNHDILKFLNKSGIDETSSQISRTLPRQDTHTSDTSVDINIFNDEMRLRNNIENMYKKGKFHNIYQELYYIENEKGYYCDANNAHSSLYSRQVFKKLSNVLLCSFIWE